MVSSDPLESGLLSSYTFRAMLALLLFLLFSRPLLAADSYFPVRELKDYGLQVFFDPASGRLLLEGVHKHQAILLLGSPYFLRDDLFLVMTGPPRIIKGELWLPKDSVESLLTPLVPLAKQKDFFARFSEKKAESPAAVKTAKADTKGNGRQEKTEINASCALGRPIKRIFLDPGHGGSDLGTKYGTLYEKDIVLRFAVLAAEELRRRGFTVSFSRTKDVYLPLDVRTELARQWKADIFISLHLNSAPDKEAHGTETYILSADATDDAARKLALLENSIIGEAKEKQSAVQDILWDMEQTVYLQDSAYLASFLQKSVVREAHSLIEQKRIHGEWKDRGVRQAPFFVLSRATMPAVLVEIGYLSNARDRALLNGKYFQESLSKALAEGVKLFHNACKER